MSLSVMAGTTEEGRGKMIAAQVRSLPGVVVVVMVVFVLTSAVALQDGCLSCLPVVQPAVIGQHGY